MGTPAVIIVNNCGIYKTCMCLKEGDLDHTGMRLQKYFNTKDSALNLVLGGDIQNLNSITERCDTCRYYNDIDSVLKDFVCSYIYLFEDGIWSLVDSSSKKRLYWYQLDLDLVRLECSLCNFEESVITDDDFGNWIAEVFLGNHNLGPVCPKCQDKFTRMTSQGECEIDLKKTISDDCPKLIRFIHQLVK